MQRMVRIMAALAGTGILAAATGLLIEANKLTGMHAALVAALAVGLGIGAVVVGHARWPLRIALLAAMLAGELFGLLGTAERIVVARDQAQAPLVAAQKARLDALRRIEQAELAALPKPSVRLQTALEAQHEAETAARMKASERGCASNCRALLEAGITAARADVAAARAAVEADQAKAQRELAAARAELAALPVPGSASPLADRLGLEPWVLDLIAAGLLAIGANGLAVALIAWAAHHRPHEGSVAARAVPEAEPLARSATTETPEPVRLEPVPVEPMRALPAPDDGDVAEFLASRTTAATGVATPVGVLFAAYQAWADDEGRQSVSLVRFGNAIAAAGLRKSRLGGRVVVEGVAPLAA